jgi:hypothetical protein
MIKQLIKRFEKFAQNDFLADSEAKSDRNGYLSYRGEWHAAMWGVGVGLFYVFTGNIIVLMAGVGWMFTSPSKDSAPKYLTYPKQFAKESLYLLAHCVAVILLGFGFKLLL